MQTIHHTSDSRRIATPTPHCSSTNSVNTEGNFNHTTVAESAQLPIVHQLQKCLISAKQVKKYNQHTVTMYNIDNQLHNNNVQVIFTVTKNFNATKVKKINVKKES